MQVSSDSDFSIENIPFGIISTAADPTPRPATAIGDFALDLSKIVHLFNGPILSSKANTVFTQVIKCAAYVIEYFKFLHGVRKISLERGESSFAEFNQWIRRQTVIEFFSNQVRIDSSKSSKKSYAS